MIQAALSASSLLNKGRNWQGGLLSRDDQAKFLLTNAAPATIQAEEADQLIDYVIDISTLFNQASVVRMNTNQKNIRFIDISGGVLRQAVCGADPQESVTISNTNKCLRTMSLDAMFWLCDDDLQDNIVGAALEAQLMRMTADTITNELEMVAHMGNVDASYSTNAATSPVVVNNNVLHLRDGWYKQLQQGHVIDARSINAAATLNEAMLRCLITAIPPKYRRNRGQFRIYMPVDMFDNDYTALLQARQTALGDRPYLEETPARWGVTPIVPVPLLPTDIQNCACYSLATASATHMFATEPSNLVLGIEKNVTFEREREARRHRTWLIWTFRADMLVFNEDATSIVDCMRLASCGDTCVPSTLFAKCGICIDLGTGGEP